MYYIQELNSLLGNVDLDKSELEVVNQFSDEFVGLKIRSGIDFRNNMLLKQAFRKIKEKKLYFKYKELLLNHAGDSIDEFVKKLDEVL